jgi:penicillin-binding protein 1A
VPQPPLLVRNDPSRTLGHPVVRTRPIPRPAPKPTRNPVRRWWREVRNPGLPLGWRVRRAVGGPFKVLALAGVLVALGIGIYAATLFPETPDAYALARATQAQPSVVYAASGQRLTQFEPAFRQWVPLDSIPGPLVEALIATEDRRFYSHGGIDIRRTVGAVWETARGNRQGGSTITQQLARNLFPEEIGRAGTAERKIKEAFAAVLIERDHTKREIVEAYLNTVPFLYNAHGVEMAARTYFGTHAPDLTTPQAATLVAMLKGPSEYNPVRRPEAALDRRNLVLRLMAQQGKLSDTDARALQDEPLGVELRPQPGTFSETPHFTAAVRRELEAWAEPRGYDIERDGLVVRTTLDLGLQRAAEAAVAERGERLQGTASREWRGGPPRAALDAALQRTEAFPQARDRGLDEADALAAVREDRALVDSVRAVATRVEAALVAIDPGTGAVRAYVGSRDFAANEYDHAGVALRQAGSTFKAFVFAGALQRGYAPTDEIEGGSVEFEMGDGTMWRPSGGTSEGTLADALAFSKNAATARLTQEVGAHRVALVAQRMGIDSELAVVPSIGLGTSSVTLLEMVSAYGTIANDGLRRAPRLITRIETRAGRVLDAFGPQGSQALTRRDARNLLDMLRGVVDRGTGRDLRAMGVTGDLAGKTGTSQRYADGWFIVMRPGLVVGSWVGFGDQRVTFRSKQTGEGSRTALPIVGAFLRRVQDRLPSGRFPGPNDTGDFLSFEMDDDSSYYPQDGGLVGPEEVDWVYDEEPFDAPPPPEPAFVRPEAEQPRLRSDAPPPAVRTAPPPARTAPGAPPAERPAYEPAPLSPPADTDE